MKLLILTIVFAIACASCVKPIHSFSIKEMWSYLPNDDESLSRQKRITDEPISEKPELSAEIFIDPMPEESEKDLNPRDALVEWHGTHVIKTVSSKEVPASVIKKSKYENSTDDIEVSSGSKDSLQIEEEADSSEPTWPAGRYGIPRSIFGCPDNSAFTWKTGYRFDDTEDDGTENQHSDAFHMAGNFSEDGIRHEFCIKDDVIGNRSWPKGKYCLYKRGPTCPAGLTEGFVIWDDENVDNANEKGGALPEGDYTDDTKIYFCCQINGDVDVPITLPVNRPFFLFPHESIKCQKVKNTRVTSEFIKFDDEDRGNIDYEGGAFPYGIHKAQKDHMLFLCFYERDPEGYPVVVTRNRTFSKGETAMSLSDLQQSLAASGSGSSDQDDEQEAMKKSEEMIKEFLVATGGEEDRHNKNERAKTIIKTIRVPSKSNRSNPVAIVVGIVLGAFVISTAIIFIAKYVLSRQGNIKPMSGQRIETTWTQNRDVISDPDSDQSDNDYRQNSKYSYRKNVDDNLFDDTYFMEEDEELVEDQLLPESELKSGLELMFLKQQRHYWNQNKRLTRQPSEYSEDNENETL